MDFSDISTLSGVTSQYLNAYAQDVGLIKSDDDDSFSSVFNAMVSSLEETNDLQNEAESEEIKFALGESENTHDMMVAEMKAYVALQYTVSVRDKLIDGYKELMQMSI